MNKRLQRGTIEAARRLKSILIDAHCRGQLPAWIVALIFKLLNLRDK
jgi:hypothetical protein